MQTFYNYLFIILIKYNEEITKGKQDLTYQIKNNENPQRKKKRKFQFLFHFNFANEIIIIEYKKENTKKKGKFDENLLKRNELEETVFVSK